MGYRERANTYYWKRKYDEALIDARKAMELAPYDGWSYAQVGSDISFISLNFEGVRFHAMAVVYVRLYTFLSVLS